MRNKLEDDIGEKSKLIRGQDFMKTGIITLIGNNYGNRLQNYAVQVLLSTYGEVYTVRYERKKPVKSENNEFRYSPAHLKKALDSRLLNLYHVSARKQNTAQRAVFYLKNKSSLKTAALKRDEAFRRFDEQYIHYAENLLHLTGDDNAPWVRRYDAWVCGSDQIWNPQYPTATRNAFLQFADQQRRIALSASIGIGKIDDMPIEYGEWIKGIPYLSVREVRAAEIVKTLSGRAAEVFFDPTMLIPIDYWNDMADKAECVVPNQYNVGYFLGVRENSYVDAINQLSGNLPLVDILNGEKLEYFAFAPDDVVRAIRGAETVFVDSFHGAVFSILFHKQFVVFERSEEGGSMNSRLETLLKRFGLENRVYNGKNLEQLREKIDYSKTDEILEKERERVNVFLNRAMNDIAALPRVEQDLDRRINISRPEYCCGCSACSQTCPKQCINMKADKEGFVYPVVDETVCVNCGRCQTVCPVEHHNGGRKPLQVLAEKNRDETIRSTSSSGGVFYSLAKQFIEDGGLVVGCALDENMVARHIIVEDIRALERLKSSKYVQSDVGNIMKEVQAALQNGRKVLFSGTPCQTAGLRNYLYKDYDNLFVVDVLCHGVPSPKLFADYLKLLSKKYGDGKPVSVNFRNKQRGWKRLYMEVCFDNGKRHYVFSGYDRYEGMFLNNLSLRPSCYECKFTKAERYGDITLGDFWGIGKKDPVWDDDKGISVVMLNTEKGKRIFKLIKDSFVGREESFALARVGQRTLYAPTMKNPKRDPFYKMYAEKGAEAALEAFTYVPSTWVRAYYAVMRKGLDVTRRIMKKGY